MGPESQTTWVVCVEQDRVPVVLDQMKDIQRRHQSVLNMDTVNAPLTSQVDQSVDLALAMEQKNGGSGCGGGGCNGGNTGCGSVACGGNTGSSCGGGCWRKKRAALEKLINRYQLK